VDSKSGNSGTASAKTCANRWFPTWRPALIQSCGLFRVQPWPLFTPVRISRDDKSETHQDE
jgi:hypothetical protein